MAWGEGTREQKDPSTCLLTKGDNVYKLSEKWEAREGGERKEVKEGEGGGERDWGGRVGKLETLGRYPVIITIRKRRFLRLTRQRSLSQHSLKLFTLPPIKLRPM
jgi:hypothetical protein